MCQVALSDLGYWWTPIGLLMASLRLTDLLEGLPANLERPTQPAVTWRSALRRLGRIASLLLRISWTGRRESSLPRKVLRPRSFTARSVTDGSLIHRLVLFLALQLQALRVYDTLTMLLPMVV